MKMTDVLDRLMAAVSLRIAWDMSRACRPTWLSPISPSISALGTRAATEFDDDHVDGAAADQHLDDLQRLLAGVRLGDQQLLGANPDPARVLGVEGVLGVDEGGDPSPASGPRR